MGLFDQFPYTNFHELNLDWILKALKELEHTIEQFVAINALKYADPIQWNIVSQYEKNTIVIDPLTGTAYISVQPVPSGVALTNTDYWTVVFDLGRFVVRASKNFATTYEAETTLTATVSTAAGGWLVWGDTLYKALVNITAGDSYVVGGNIAHFTMENIIGHLEDLTTTDKSNVVAAINEVASEVLGKIGDLADLTTTDKSNLVAAVNEVVADIEAEAQAREDAIEAEALAREDAINNRMYTNLSAYDPDPTGVQSSVTAINNAANDAKGGRILFEQGDYLLDSDVNAISNELDFSRSNFSGAGAGDPSSYNGKFASPITNPGNKVAQLLQKTNIDNIINPVGNGVVLNSHEIDQSNSNDFITVTGSISSGSSVLTVSDSSNIDRGDGIILVSPTISAWPDGNTRANTMRVVSVNGNEITIGPDNSNGNGNAVATPWTETSITNGTFNIRKRKWQVVDFNGINSPAAINPDRINWVRNDIINLNGSIGNGYEIEVNNFGSGASEYSRGVFITGRGSGSMPIAALDIQRANYEASQNWNIGVSINSAAVGIQIKASKGITIDTNWDDAYTQTTQELYTGIEFTNISDAVRAVRPLFAGKNIVNGASGIVLQRAQDTDAAGYYLQFMNSDATDNIFTVDTNGTVLAGIYKVKQFVNVDNTITLKGYIIMQDANGDPVKVMVAN